MTYTELEKAKEIKLEIEKFRNYFAGDRQWPQNERCREKLL